MEMKYVKTDDLQFIVFPTGIQHNQLNIRCGLIGLVDIVSAGFCLFDDVQGIVHCYGRSVSLKLESDVNDSKLATEQFFSVEQQ